MIISIGVPILTLKSGDIYGRADLACSHEHSAECYLTQDGHICSEEDGCTPVYRTEITVIQQGHRHGDECYMTGEGHWHDAGCYSDSYVGDDEDGEPVFESVSICDKIEGEPLTTLICDVEETEDVTEETVCTDLPPLGWICRYESDLICEHRDCTLGDPCLIEQEKQEPQCQECDDGSCEACQGAKCQECDDGSCEACQGAKCQECDDGSCEACQGAKCQECDDGSCEACQGAKSEECDGTCGVCEACMGQPNARLEVVPAMMFLAQNATVYSFAELVAAVAGAPTNGELYVIEIGGSFDFTNAVAIASGKNITLASDGNYTLRTSGNFRHFDVSSGGRLTLGDAAASGTLTIEGQGLTSGNFDNGGIIVRSGGALTIDTGALIQRCYAATNGGGVFSSGTVLMNGGTVNGNYATIGGGGISIDSASTGAITVTGGTISGNWTGRTGMGGGIYNAADGGRVTNATIINNGIDNQGAVLTHQGGGIASVSPIEITNCTISDNAATYGGGGVYSNSSSSSALTITGGVISGNFSIQLTVDSQNGYGGGVYSDAYAGKVVINGATIRDNGKGFDGGSEVRTGNGGGVYTRGPTEIKDSTITGNYAYASGGGIYSESALDFRDSIVSKNVTADDARGGGVCILSGQMVMHSGEISQNTSGSGGGIFVNTQGSFLMNGGTISGNEAYGRTSDSGGGGIFSRSTMNGVSPNPSAVHITGGTISGNWVNSISLRSGGGAICSTTTGGKVTIEGDAKIIDNGLNGAGELKTNMGGGLYIAGILEIKGGRISGNAAINNGGGVYSSNTVEMTGGEISNNRTSANPNTVACGGGGIYMNHFNANSTVTLRITGGTISGNWTESQPGYGGGIYFNNSYTASSFTISNATITGNGVNNGAARTSSGGGIYTICRLTISNSTIAGNAARENGGGVYTSDCAMTMQSGAIIRNNTAEYNGKGNGGGVYASGGTMTMQSGAIVSNNYARYEGGGIYIENGDLTMTGNAAIKENVSDSAGGGVAYRTKERIYRFVMSDDARIEGNTADDRGGGVIMWGDERQDFIGYVIMEMSDRATVAQNKAVYEGGGINVAWDCVLEMRGNSAVIDNQADVGGGGIFLDGGSLNMSGNSMVSNNKVIWKESGIHGGYAAYGGGVGSMMGIITIRENGKITNNELYTNSAHSWSGGGGVFLWAYSTMDMYDNALISGNRCSNGPGGGGVFLTGEYESWRKNTLNMYGSSAISGNWTDGSGGGVYANVRDNYGASVAPIVNLVSGSVINNTAVKDGGGIYAEDYTSVTVNRNVAFGGNTAGKGPYWLEDYMDGSLYVTCPANGTYTAPIEIAVGAIKALHNGTKFPANGSIALSAPRAGVTSVVDKYTAFNYLANNFDLNFVGDPNGLRKSTLFDVPHVNYGVGSIPFIRTLYGLTGSVTGPSLRNHIINTDAQDVTELMFAVSDPVASQWELLLHCGPFTTNGGGTGAMPVAVDRSGEIVVTAFADQDSTIRMYSRNQYRLDFPGTSSSASDEGIWSWDKLEHDIKVEAYLGGGVRAAEYTSVFTWTFAMIPNYD